MVGNDWYEYTFNENNSYTNVTVNGGEARTGLYREPVLPERTGRLFRHTVMPLGPQGPGGTGKAARYIFSDTGTAAHFALPYRRLRWMVPADSDESRLSLRVGLSSEDRFQPSANIRIFAEIVVMVDFDKVPSPCFVLDERLLRRNLAVIDKVRQAAGVEIIVALKACAMWRIFPLLREHSDGATASSVAEARLVLEEYGSRAHTYAPVYTENDFPEIMRCSDHITFNSLGQWGALRRPGPAERHILRAAGEPGLFDGGDRPL